MPLSLRLIVGALILSLIASCGELADDRSSNVSPTDNQVSTKYLSANAYPVYRFAKYASGAYFYTADQVEAQTVRTLYANVFRDEGIAFYGLSDGQPVYRFANLNNGGYFFTSSEEEQQTVRAAYPHMRYEGVSFRVPTHGVAAPTKATFRLANLVSGAYLYTTSVDEIDFATALKTADGKDPIWRFEGAAFAVVDASSQTAMQLTQVVELATNPNFDPQGFSALSARNSDVVVAWRAKSRIDTETKMLARVFRAAAWQPEFELSSSTALLFGAPKVVQDPSGKLWVVWFEFDASNNDAKLMSRHLGETGAWGAALLIWQGTSEKIPKLTDVVITGLIDGMLSQQFFNVYLEYYGRAFFFPAQWSLFEVALRVSADGQFRATIPLLNGSYIIGETIKIPMCGSFQAFTDTATKKVTTQLVFSDRRWKEAGANFTNSKFGPWVSELVDPSAAQANDPFRYTWDRDNNFNLTNPVNSWEGFCAIAQNRSSASFYSAPAKRGPVFWSGSSLTTTQYAGLTTRDRLWYGAMRSGLTGEIISGLESVSGSDSITFVSSSSNDSGQFVLSGLASTFNTGLAKERFILGSTNGQASSLAGLPTIARAAFDITAPIVTLSGKRYGLVVNFDYFPAAQVKPFELKLYDLSDPSNPQVTMLNNDVPWRGGQGIQRTIIYPDGTTTTSRFFQSKPELIADRQGRLTIVWEEPTGPLSSETQGAPRSTLLVKRLQ